MPRLQETDFVLFYTGFHGDQRLLEMAGVELRGENRVPVFDPETMETNVPGLYLAGTVAAGIQQRYTPLHRELPRTCRQDHCGHHR